MAFAEIQQAIEEAFVGAEVRFDYGTLSETLTTFVTLHGSAAVVHNCLQKSLPEILGELDTQLPRD